MNTESPSKIKLNNLKNNLDVELIYRLRFTDRSRTDYKNVPPKHSWSEGKVDNVNGLLIGVPLGSRFVIKNLDKGLATDTVHSVVRHGGHVYVCTIFYYNDVLMDNKVMGDDEQDPEVDPPGNVGNPTLDPD
jgi:hypothetical protein